MPENLKLGRTSNQRRNYLGRPHPRVCLPLYAPTLNKKKFSLPAKEKESVAQGVSPSAPSDYANGGNSYDAGRSPESQRLIHIREFSIWYSLTACRLYSTDNYDNKDVLWPLLDTGQSSISATPICDANDEFGKLFKCLTTTPATKRVTVDYPRDYETAPGNSREQALPKFIISFLKLPQSHLLSLSPSFPPLSSDCGFIFSLCP